MKVFGIKFQLKRNEWVAHDRSTQKIQWWSEEGHCGKNDNYSVINTLFDIDKAYRCTASAVRYKKLWEECSGMSNKKNLLIYAHYYIPDTASTGQILRELAEGMLDKFNITVICVVPSYLGTIEDKYKTQKYYEEEINGVKVLRIRVPEFSKTNKKSRVKNIVSYFFGAMGATFKVGKMDYVFSISQPPILGGECEIIWATREKPDFMRVCAAWPFHLNLFLLVMVRYG